MSDTGPKVERGEDMQLRVRKIANGYLLLSGGESWYTKTIHEMAAATTVAVINWGRANGDGDEDSA